MPHATMDADDDLFGELDLEPLTQEQLDDEQAQGDGGDGFDLGQLLQEAVVTEGDGKFDINDFLDKTASRDLEVGEKAVDAVDYEDIADDDLAEDEDAIEAERNGDRDDGDLDDLFNESSSPIQDRSQSQKEDTSFTSLDSQTGPVDGHSKGEPNFRNVNYSGSQDADLSEFVGDEKGLKAYLMQQQLFHNRNAPTEQNTGRFEEYWPNFEASKPPRFHSLLPRKRAYFMPRIPLKPPKPIQPNKVSLDIAADQEKTFRLPSTGATTKAGRQHEEEQRGMVYITDGVDEDDSRVNDDMQLDDLDGIDETEPVGNISWNDLKIACEDWDPPDLGASSDDENLQASPETVADGEDWIHNLAANPPKKRRLADRSQPVKFSVYDHMDLPSWDDPELATAQISKKIILDMNDPHLLLDVQQSSTDQKRPRPVGLALKRDNRGSLANPMFKRYNISNDEAYDALKENNQQKVRSTLGHMNVEHSLPALKLQYPFYKVNLSDRELRSFHRPSLMFKPGERVSIEPSKGQIKRKHKKNLKPSEAFASAEDLNIGDGSDLLLAEYSEEYPTTLSNFGMGNKIVNYYRRKDADDTSRPKQDLGDTMVLLPQDKSPFSLFGSVEPGETVPTLLNAMYRAPVFQHTPKPTDFLVSRSHTGVKGSHYYLRNLQNLVVVGQEFPSVEVPGTHARKVTEASKKRLKMLAFRLYRKGQQRGARHPWVSNEMIKHHLPGTEIAQNRSRMREIMKYDKEVGTWRPQDGEVIPDEPSLRTWIKPEDICLIDSMHAGDRHLTDAGFKANEINEDEDLGDDSTKVELKLAPWQTTKNFLNACQGKAMLELHGSGDPTGRGEAFSFIKVSMKGGFKDVGESIGDKMDATKRKEMGGHSYNVAHQQKIYENAIQRIWNKQQESLSSQIEHSDVEMEDVDNRHHDLQASTPRYQSATPGLPRAEEDTASQFSRSSANFNNDTPLRIKRLIKNKYDEYETQVVTITDPEVIKLYTRRKKQMHIESMRFEDMQLTGNAEVDAMQKAKLEAELARLKRNVERREGREKAKAKQNNLPGVAGAKGGATVRKCANCGEVGHIKTNKKLCPLLNGQKKPSDTFKDATAPSPVNIAATPISATPGGAGSPL